MFPDFKELLSVFNAHSVKYLIVGGYAVSFYAQPRATKDIDLFVKADPSNARAVFAALSAFGAPLDGIRAEDLADPKNFIRFGREPMAIDIFPGIDGIDFEAAWKRRVEGVIDHETGLTAFFVSRDDLIASKLAAGRMRDLADVEDLRDAAASQRQDAEPNPGPTDGGPKQ